MRRGYGRRWAWLTLLAGVLLSVTPSAAVSAKGSAVFINSRFADRAEAPTRFSPDDITTTIGKATGIYYALYNDYVRDISWNSWGGESATGSGQVSLLTEDDKSTSPVTVTLGDRRRCAGLEVYTTYSLTLAAGATAPPGWAEGRSGRFPCVIALPGGYQGERLGQRSNCISGLYQPNANPRDLPVAPWQPKPRGGHWFLCKLHFSSWGNPRAVGGGTAALPSHAVSRRHEWQIRIELSKPVWCPRAGDGYSSAITYSALTFNLLGGNPSNEGGRRRYSQSMHAGSSRCQLR
jgi:hypothetical protein